MTKSGLLLLLTTVTLVASFLTACGSSKPKNPGAANLYGFVIDSIQKDTVSSGTVRLFYRGIRIFSQNVYGGQYRFLGINADCCYDIEYTEAADTVVLGRVTGLEPKEGNNKVNLAVGLLPPPMPMPPPAPCDTCPGPSIILPKD